MNPEMNQGVLDDLEELSRAKEELEQIKERLTAAGVQNFTTPLQGVSFICRLLDESQKEALSLRRRINELLQHVKVQSQSAHSPEVLLSNEGDRNDSQSTEGGSLKHEGSDSRAGMESSKRQKQKEV